ALKVEVRRRQRHRADIEVEHALGDALEVAAGQGAQHGDVAEHGAAAHVEALDPVEGGIEQVDAGVEMLVEVQVDRLAGFDGGGKEDVEIARRILGNGGRSP